MTESNNDIRQFFDMWSVYEHVLERNYMFHNEILANASEWMAVNLPSRPLRVLDLGCGSCRHFSAILAQRMIASYVGYDLSQSALDHARENLRNLKCPASLKCADLFSAFEHEPPDFDLIFTAYAAHHFVPAEKQRLFESCRRLLRPGGAMILVDIVCNQGESRQSWADRYCGWIESAWTTIPPDVRKSIFDHIRGSDLPESKETLAAMSVKAGFTAVAELPSFGSHATLCLGSMQE